MNRKMLPLARPVDLRHAVSVALGLLVTASYVFLQACPSIRIGCSLSQCYVWEGLDRRTHDRGGQARQKDHGRQYEDHPIGHGALPCDGHGVRTKRFDPRESLERKHREGVGSRLGHHWVAEHRDRRGRKGNAGRRHRSGTAQRRHGRESGKTTCARQQALPDDDALSSRACSGRVRFSSRNHPDSAQGAAGRDGQARRGDDPSASRAEKTSGGSCSPTSNCALRTRPSTRN